MTMKHIVAAPAELTTQRMDEANFFTDRDRRTDDLSAHRVRLRVQFPRVGKIAVEGPVHRDPALAAEPQHPDQPILDGTAVEVFDDMDDFSSDWGARQSSNGKACAKRK